MIQDLVAPDVRELKTLVIALQQQIDLRFEAQEQRFEAQERRAEAESQKADAQIKALMSAFGEFKAQAS